MKPKTSNIISSPAEEKSQTPSATIDPTKEPDLLSPEATLRLKKITKWVLYIMVVVGFPLTFWLFVGTDYAMAKDKLAWIAILSIFGVFFIKFVENDLGWKSIKRTFLIFAVLSLLLITGKEAFFHEKGEKKSSVDFSLISAGHYIKKKVQNYQREKTLLKNNPKQETSDTIYLEPNKLYVSPALKKGETSKIWIDGPLSIVTTRHIGRRGKKNLALLLDNGKVYNYTQGELPPKDANYKFKFIGLEDGAIGTAKYTTD